MGGKEGTGGKVGTFRPRGMMGGVDTFSLFPSSGFSFSLGLVESGKGSAVGISLIMDVKLRVRREVIFFIEAAFFLFLFAFGNLRNSILWILNKVSLFVFKASSISWPRESGVSVSARG